METTNTAVAMEKFNARMAKLGFKGAKQLGMNILNQEVGEPVFVKIEEAIADFEAKKIDPKTKQPAVYKFIRVTNLETGETGLTYWVSGQLRYLLEELGNYTGRSFAITWLGKQETEDGDFNKFDVKELV